MRRARGVQKSRDVVLVAGVRSVYKWLSMLLYDQVATEYQERITELIEIVCCSMTHVLKLIWVDLVGCLYSFQGEVLYTKPTSSGSQDSKLVPYSQPSHFSSGVTLQARLLYLESGSINSSLETKYKACHHGFFAARGLRTIKISDDSF